MPEHIDEFTYIPPHEWERLKKQYSLERPPTMPMPAELVSTQGTDGGNAKTAAAKSAKPAMAKVATKARAASPTKSTRPKKTTPAVPPPPSYPIPKRVAPLKRKAAQNRTSTSTVVSTNTNKNTSTEYGKGEPKWQALGGGFWYAPGPTVAKPVRQWTWRERGQQLMKWGILCFLCSIVYGLFL